jgi:hypothetical protein
MLVALGADLNGSMTYNTLQDDIGATLAWR